MAGEKSEKPTAKRLREARREGRTPRSQDVSGWVVLLLASFLLPWTLRRGTDTARGLLLTLPGVAANPDPALLAPLLGRALWDGAMAVLPAAAILVLAGFTATAGQGGVHLATKGAKPTLRKLDPRSGLKRMLGAQGAVEAGKALLKAALLGWVGWSAVVTLTRSVAGAGVLPLSASVAATTSAALTLIRWSAVLGLALAVGDYAHKRRTIGRKLRMSKQEVKEESRSSEGDPQLKAAIRSRQMALGRNRMMAEVARADVVVVNPTHVAVALRYTPGRGAPVVVARGAGHVAARIREQATANRVPMISDVPLARTLYAACRLGSAVPPELFDAVARVLAFVFALRRGQLAPGAAYRPLTAA